jgi:hypothetical protein
MDALARGLTLTACDFCHRHGLAALGVKYESKYALVHCCFLRLKWVLLGVKK